MHGCLKYYFFTLCYKYKNLPASKAFHGKSTSMKNQPQNLEFKNDRENFHSYTVKPVLSGHSKIDKTKIITTNGSLMKVESIAECSLGAFCNTFDLH